MKKLTGYFIVGLVFAIGLGYSGMTKPEKVIGFLDIFRQWDPSLMFVMVGAIGVHFIAYKIIRKKPSPLLDTQWYVPEKKEITKPLILGSLLFGVGWGLGGYCPGPGVVSLASFQLSPLVFVFGMVAGMGIFRLVDSKLKWNR